MLIKHDAKVVQYRNQWQRPPPTHTLWRYTLIMSSSNHQNYSSIRQFVNSSCRHKQIDNLASFDYPDEVISVLWYRLWRHLGLRHWCDFVTLFWLYEWRDWIDVWEHQSSRRKKSMLHDECWRGFGIELVLAYSCEDSRHERGCLSHWILEKGHAMMLMFFCGH